MSATQTRVLLHNRKLSQTSALTSTFSLPPAYEPGDYIELDNLSTTSSRSSSSPPQYNDLHLSAQGTSSSSSSSRPTFHCTKAFQIEARGHPLLAFPHSPRRTPISIYHVDLSTGIAKDLAYQSLRPIRGSGNSNLIRAGDSENDPICRTTYRFGPGKPPKLELCGLMAYEEEFEVVNKGLTTRAQVFRTHLGTFQWRYAGREERKAAGADNLMVLDRIVKVALEGGKQEEKRIPVARLVRNAEVRSKETRITTAGNGGRLMMNLMEWEGIKGDAEQMEVLVVASCLVMLKKEVDRRRMHQAIAMTSPCYFV
ncbi:hypothetical protein TGAM01_v205350 [Trichoderma gamsii]|uniref:Uncharacterized protein n=1 Tax=Trichoderma gamsii TaxID=398673 RepID=A0A0W7VHB5_9HYPO|nr:hypothetical protein TGAM01_v205350 [Trichoderma gamsii]PNP39052.1 hypothetical protein TGAMA5MH_09279 [Trichoderma gamsii]PON25912.1 hypothetical protein TGAM01_v205350 [Trichoderma gamsii]